MQTRQVAWMNTEAVVRLLLRALQLAKSERDVALARYRTAESQAAQLQPSTALG